VGMSFLEQLSKELSVAASACQRMDILEKLVAGINGDDGRDVENLLVNILRADENPIVRHEVAFVLGKLYERGDIQGEITLAQLCDSALSDCSVVVRHEATEVLGCFSAVSAIETLQKLANDPNHDISATAQISLERLIQVSS
jgi:HEAT repeat protein